MKDDQDYIRDIAAMRTLMERSSKFRSLSGVAGILAGVYALVGVFIANKVYYFNPSEITDSAATAGSLSTNLTEVVFLAIVILILAVGTAFSLSYKKATERGEKCWNPTTRRLLINMAVPLVAGGLLVLILLAKGLIGFIAPFTLLFYGLALYNISKFTYEEMSSLGLIQIGLGLVSSYFVEYGLLCWALGFGIANIVYGIYIHYRYER